MATDSSIHLDAERRRKLEQIAELNGKSASELVRDAIDHYLAEHVQSEPKHGDTLYDIAKSTGAIGLLKGGPTDVSTNPKYLKGFGQNG